MKLTTKIALVLCISVLLFNSCSNDESTKTEETIADTSSLKTFTDVSFSLDQSEGFTAGRYFSSELGKTFKANEITAEILPKIDIAFYSADHSLNYFISPNEPEYGIKNATSTIYINYQEDLMTIDQFNKIEKGTNFDTIKIDADDEESFPDSSVPNIVLFKNAAGKKGAIHIKSVHRVGYDPRIVVDIKIQK